MALPDNTQERLEELEMKVSFLDDMLNDLNDVIAKQDRELQDLWTANRILKESIKESQNEGGSMTQEPPPPHY